MKLEISAVFIKGAEKEVKKEIKIGTQNTIENIIKELGIINVGYANFILNGQIVEQSNEVKDQDHLIIIPIFSGG